MGTGQIVGLVVGLLVAGAGVYLALRAAGYFQYLGGKKRSSIPPVTKETLMGRLLNLNDLSKPYSIVEGKDTDLVAEWKIIDAAWYMIFSKSPVRQAYRARLLLDEARHTVRCYEEMGRISWVEDDKGLRPVVSYKRGFFMGRGLGKKEHKKGYAIKEAMPEAGEAHEYKLDINEIRKPIVSVVRESGWEWVPVTAKRYATFKQSR